MSFSVNGKRSGCAWRAAFFVPLGLVFHRSYRGLTTHRAEDRSQALIRKVLPAGDRFRGKQQIVKKSSAQA
jgi:hypothetical protein